jgi:hypothetical protein
MLQGRRFGCSFVIFLPTTPKFFLFAAKKSQKFQMTNAADYTPKPTTKDRVIHGNVKNVVSRPRFGCLELPTGVYSDLVTCC